MSEPPGHPRRIRIAKSCVSYIKLVRGILQYTLVLQTSSWCQAVHKRVANRAASTDSRPQSVKSIIHNVSERGAILPHGATPPHTLCLGGLGPGSRNFKISPTPRPNLKIIAVPSSTQRVLQLWSNRTWSTWLPFWSRKWPSEASTSDP